MDVALGGLARSFSSRSRWKARISTSTPCIDVRPFKRLMKGVAVFGQACLVAESTHIHDAGDAIVLMLHNNVLPWELLHVVYGFLM